MSAISPFIAGMVGNLHRQAVAAPMSASANFAGLLDVSFDDAYALEAQNSSASGFADLGMFGRHHALTGVDPTDLSDAPDVMAEEADAAAMLQASGATWGKNTESLARPHIPADIDARPWQLPTTRGSRQHPGETAHEPVEAEACLLPAGLCDNPALDDPTTRTTLKDDTFADRNFVGAAVRGLPAAPNRPTAKAAQTAVHLTVMICEGQAEVIARGGVQQSELIARLSNVLAEHDLELAGLRLNGSDQPLPSRIYLGGNHGSRQRQ